MLAAVLVHPAISITLGAAALAALWWYWSVLGGAEVPVSRRRLRRVTTMLLLVAIPLLVAGMSFIDRQSHPREFITAWMLVIVLMLLIILGAALDAFNSVRLHQIDLEREMTDAAKELQDAMKRARRSNRKDDEG